MAIEEKSYGIIPLKQVQGRWKVFLVQHRAGHWAFPKGHAEPSESAQQTAERELKEETGLSVASYLSDQPLIESYYFFFQKKRIHKTVMYYLARVKGRAVIQEAEISYGKWFNLDEAIDKITFPEGKRICRQVQDVLKTKI